MAESLEMYLLVAKAELLIRRKKLGDFVQEVAISNVIHAINEALKVIEENGEGKE